MFEHDHATVAEYLDNLRGAGFDLSQPVAVEHYLYFPLASLAQGAAEDLRREGFTVNVEPDEERGGWIAYTTRAAHATPDEILRARDGLVAFVEARQGAYEGWNVVPEPDEEPAADFDV